MNQQQIKAYTEKMWDDSIIPELKKYIKIPCKSPAYDRDWENNGYLEKAIKLLTSWAKTHPAANMQLDVVQLPERTPLIFIEIPGNIDETILLYGHMDKQPEMTGWEEGFGPWQPILKDDKLYGRGGADDGYSIFAALTAILALQQQNLPHARCIIMIEASEESGSPDLPAYIEHLNERIETPSLIICLDSGAGDYKRMWSTTSLRGLLGGTLCVDILTEGVHSGIAGGAVPDSFRILRQLLSRLEDENTGEVLVPECFVSIPEQRIEQSKDTATILNKEVYQCFPFVEDAVPMRETPEEIILARTWYPNLTITGMAGLPTLENAGNVLRPYTKAKLSFRLPPTCDIHKAAAAVSARLEANSPYGAKVNFTIDDIGAGWNAPELSPWLHKAANNASKTFFGNDTAYMGEGGSIPFMGMLGKKFPKAQFLITGVLGPKSNAHGPNEFLHIPMAKKITCCIADVIAAHYQHFST